VTLCQICQKELQEKECIFLTVWDDPMIVCEECERKLNKGGMKWQKQ